MGLNRSEKFKMLLFLQIAAKIFQSCPDFSSQWSSQNYLLDIFEILSFRFFTIFSQNFIFTIVPYGETQSLKCLEKEGS